MKAEMGIIRRAMAKAGISFDKSSNQKKPRVQAVNGKQKGKFEGAAKTMSRTNQVSQRSYVPVPKKDEISDSHDEPQQEYGELQS
jgi:hypothetical protein